MRLLHVPVLAALVGLSTPLFGQPAAPAAEPKLFVEKAEIDLGRIERGKEVEAVFRIRNDGKEILRILSAKPG